MKHFNPDEKAQYKILEAEIKKFSSMAKPINDHLHNLLTERDNLKLKAIRRGTFFERLLYRIGIYWE